MTSARRRRIILAGILMATLILNLFMFPPLSLAGEVRPELYRPQAGPGTVNYGMQPEGSPLVLSVESRRIAGEIVSITVNLSALVAAKYYDPASGTVKDAGSDVPMARVYLVDGEAAYKVWGGRKYEYKKTLTHETLKGTPVATDRWQVELPHVGNIRATFDLRVTATNMLHRQGTVNISLEVVSDLTAPGISLEARYLINSAVTRAGDKVTIEAQVTDDLSGVFSVRLLEDGAGVIFGENPDLTPARQGSSDVWKVENTVAGSVMPGVYSVSVAALDRAGNEAIETVKIEVAERITSLKIGLEQGWNLLSVPRALQNPAVSQVFAGLPVGSVRTMIAGRWLEVAEIRPGLGYLVKMTAPATVVVNFREHDPSMIPFIIDLGPGWNLIGYASRTLEPMMPLAFYLGGELRGRWAIVYADDGEHVRSWPVSPHIWATDGFPTITGEPYSEDPSDNLPAVELGKGYWIYLTEEGILVP